MDDFKKNIQEYMKTCDLFEMGLITPSEFFQKKQEILSNLGYVRP